MPGGGTRYRARFYVDPHGLTMGGYETQKDRQR
jgi:hypothetical protein